MVAIGAKACPHCGKDNPAPPKKPTSRIKTVGAAFFVLFLVYLMFGEGGKTGGSSGTRSAEQALERHGVLIGAAAKAGALQYLGVEKTTEAPLRAYKVSFESRDASLMSDPAGASDRATFLRNQGLAAVWKAKFCTSELSTVMRQYGVGMVSGQIVNGKGEIQSIAMCFP